MRIQWPWKLRPTLEGIEFSEFVLAARNATCRAYEPTAWPDRGRVSGFEGTRGQHKFTFSGVSLTFGDSRPEARGPLLTVESRSVGLWDLDDLEQDVERWLLVMAGRRERFSGPFEVTGCAASSQATIEVDGRPERLEVRQVDSCWYGWSAIGDDRVIMRARDREVGADALRTADLAEYWSEDLKWLR